MAGFYLRLTLVINRLESRNNNPTSEKEIVKIPRLSCGWILFILLIVSFFQPLTALDILP